MDEEHSNSGARRHIFVNSVSTDNGQRSTFKRQAKAHTAKVNWQRYKGRVESQRVATEGAANVTQAPKNAGFNVDDDGDGVTTVSNYDHSDHQATMGYDSSGDMELLQSTTANQQPPNAPASWLLPAVAPLRTVSPIFGALPARSFEAGDSSSVAQSANYLCNVVLKNTLQPSEISAWFLGLSQSPVIFHTLSYAVGVYQSLNGSVISKRQQQQMLMHKGKTISLINKLLSNLDNADLKAIMLAMFVLWRANPRSYVLERSDTSLFSPHMPGANWMGVYGQSEAIDAHAQALYWLVNRVGGAEYLSFPGLRFVLLVGNLIKSSSRLTEPRFPCVWQARTCLQVLQPMIAAEKNARLSAEFSYRIPKGLPSRAFDVYRDLVQVDLLFDLSRQRRLDDVSYAMIVAARNGTQYALLSLQMWPDLLDKERGSSHRAIYGMRRLSSVIYANSVLFPIPASTGWLAKSLGELHQLLEMSNLTSWREDTSAVLTWCLFVAGIAAFRTRHRRFFWDSLRALLISTRITTWDEAETIVQEFLWTDSACGQGATVLWDSLDLESGWT